MHHLYSNMSVNTHKNDKDNSTKSKIIAVKDNETVSQYQTVVVNTGGCNTAGNGIA